MSRRTERIHRNEERNDSNKNPDGTRFDPEAKEKRVAAGPSERMQGGGGCAMTRRRGERERETRIKDSLCQIPIFATALLVPLLRLLRPDPT